ncbi:MAG: hypothetical protein JRF54_04450 [Deltaproteobacteria bacterium]|nr:hypothetical protein [Deltaproteobacteria bacterium]MBW2545618.1 hypothetical protein [Deltaproteobacteria bacterium]MBW2717228.1 hypothetical protein [Deltaproteobacteria bacterium]
MRTYAGLFLSMGLIFSFVGCGDSGSGGGGGSAGSGGSGGSGGGGTATVSGTVFSAALEDDSTPLAGATVAVVGTTTSTVSGMDGSFSIEAPVGIGRFLTTAADAWGELLTGNVPAGGIDMVDTEVVPDALVAGVADALMETIDPTKAMVVVEFDMEVPAGGEAAELGVNYDFAFVFNADGDPVLGNELLPGGDTIVLFANVDIGADVMPTATNPGGAACPPDPAGVAYPSQQKVFTGVEVVCP